MEKKKYIYILNFGDYFAKTTARHIKRCGGKPRIVTFNTPYEDLKEPAGFILSGAPNGSMRLPVRILCKELFATNLPVIGVCVGAQLMARYFGGNYKCLKNRAENGIFSAYLNRRSKILKGLEKQENVVMMHNDSIVNPGENFIVIGKTDRCPVAVTMHRKWRWYMFQFHPELSPCGNKIFENFVNLCHKDIPKEKPGIKGVEKELQNN